MDVQKLYEKYHDSRKKQKRVISENDFTYSHIIQLLSPHIKSNNKVLDIGCGTGTIGLFLASKGMRVVGTDISKNAIYIAKENAKELGLTKSINFTTSKFPAQKISGKYDLVILSEVLEHLGNEDKAVKLLSSTITKGGVALITVPSQNAPLYKLGLLKGFDKEVGHLRRYNSNQLKKLFNSNKTKIISLTKSEGILRNFLFTNHVAGKFVRYVNRLIPRLFNSITWTN